LDSVSWHSAVSVAVTKRGLFRDVVGQLTLLAFDIARLAKSAKVIRWVRADEENIELPPSERIIDVSFSNGIVYDTVLNKTLIIAPYNGTVSTIRRA
jgi:hypothetical protein